jgi:methylmalonyl-CoA mutase C-terminal domain/subunit
MLYCLEVILLMEKKIKVLIAKPGLDGHDRGALVVVHALRNAGMEVIYTGRHNTPQGIAAIAKQENVDLIGLSILSGAHLHLSREVVKTLREIVNDTPVIVGGVIPEKDIPILKQIGVAEVFPVGSKLETIVDYINGLMEGKRNSQ